MILSIIFRFEKVLEWVLKRCSDVIINTSLHLFMLAEGPILFHIQRDIILHIRGIRQKI